MKNLHTQLKELKTLVVGLGVTGLSCANYLSEQGARVRVTDTQDEPRLLSSLLEARPDVEVSVGGFKTEDFDWADIIVTSPGVPLSTPAIEAAIEAGKPVIGDVELFAWANAHGRQVPTLGVTGSNGKSTVVDMLGFALNASGYKTEIGGNIGRPVLELLNTDAEYFVVELSSFQLETTHSLELEAAVVLNVSQDHLDRYDSFESYAQAKARIYDNAEVCIYNADDSICEQLVNFEKPSVCFSSRENYCDWMLQGNELYCDDRCLANFDDFTITGKHNAHNVLAALALLEASGVAPKTVIPAMQQYRGLPARCEVVADKEGVLWVNDSKATNVGATVAAVNGFDRAIVLIAGGQGKAQDFAPLKEVLDEKAHTVILMGEDAELIAQAIGHKHMLFATEMKDAVEKAKEEARAGDVVLLSPACASFDMFDGYLQRGEAFAEAVKGVA